MSQVGEGWGSGINNLAIQYNTNYETRNKLEQRPRNLTQV